MEQQHHTSPQDKKWWEEPNRLLLINIREGDEHKLVPEELVANAQKFDATAFSLNGGGIVAFYDTKVLDHPKSKSLGDRDLLAEVIPVAHREGIKVLARIDPSCASKIHSEKHPEWFSRDKDGNMYPVSGHYVTCPNGGYYNDYMLVIVRELLENYDIDGMWNNHGKFSAWDTGTCYCNNCRRIFKEDSGFDIPLKEDWKDPIWLTFNEWRYKQIAKWIKIVYDLKNQIKPEVVWTAAVQLMESWDFSRPGGWDVDYWIEHQDVITVECQRRYTVPWWPGAQAKYLQTNAPDKPRWMTASYFYPWWRVYSAPEEENRFWLAQQFAFGTSTWLHINGGYSDYFDRRGYKPLQEVMNRQGRWAEYFDDAKSAAKTALVYSRFTMDNYAGDSPEKKYLDHFRGYYLALMENHIPFDILSDKFLCSKNLDKYSVLVLPNTACMSDDSAEAVRKFARDGGTVITTFETGMFDEMGKKRDKPLFEEAFGGEYLGYTRDNLKSSYANIEISDDEMLKGIGDTDILPNDGSMVLFRPDASRTVPLTLIPPVQAHAGSTISIPEYSLIDVTTDHPILSYGSYGEGKTVYFSNQMDLLFYRYGFRDLGMLLANAVWAGLGEAADIIVSAPENIEIAYVSQSERKLVHLINYPVGIHLNTGWRRPGQTIIPAKDITVKLKIENLTKVRLLNSNLTLEPKYVNGWAEVTVPELSDHEIVVFE